MIRAIAVSTALAAAAIGVAGCGGSSMPSSAFASRKSTTHRATAPGRTSASHSTSAVAPKTTATSEPTPASASSFTSSPSTTATASPSTIAIPAPITAITWDAKIARDANGFALGGPAPAQPLGGNPSRRDCLIYLAQDRAWSNYQNEHRPPGSHNALPSSGDVQYLFVVCHLNYYGNY